MPSTTSIAAQNNAPLRRELRFIARRSLAKTQPPHPKRRQRPPNHRIAEPYSWRGMSPTRRAKGLGIDAEPRLRRQFQRPTKRERSLPFASDTPPSLQSSFSGTSARVAQSSGCSSRQLTQRPPTTRSAYRCSHHHRPHPLTDAGIGSLQHRKYRRTASRAVRSWLAVGTWPWGREPPKAQTGSCTRRCGWPQNASRATATGRHLASRCTAWRRPPAQPTWQYRVDL
jgi:hypothetical protein